MSDHIQHVKANWVTILGEACENKEDLRKIYQTKAAALNELFK